MDCKKLEPTSAEARDVLNECLSVQYENPIAKEPISAAKKPEDRPFPIAQSGAVVQSGAIGQSGPIAQSWGYQLAAAALRERWDKKPQNASRLGASMLYGYSRIASTPFSCC
jgi:hypothetical protein